MILIHPKPLEEGHTRETMSCPDRQLSVFSITPFTEEESASCRSGKRAVIAPHRPQPADLGLGVFQHHQVIAYGPDKGQLLKLTILLGAALTGSGDHASVEILYNIK